MNHQIFCINSDAVNRYGYRLHITGLVKNVSEYYHKGIPLLINHDFHRPAGWIIPLGTYIQPHLTRSLAVKFMPEEEQEIKSLVQRFRKYVFKKNNERFNQIKNEFLDLIESKIAGDYDVIDTGCVGVINEGIAARLFPNAFIHDDKDGLIPLRTLLTDFTYQGQGVFKHRSSNLSLFAHAYFRRSQSRLNNFRFFFLDALLKENENEKATIKIKLDADLIGFSPTFHEVGELEYHYGPEYTDDISTIRSGISRYQCSEYERIMDEVSAAEFYWKHTDDEMTFEMEEIKDNTSPASTEKFLCRYVHSIYDKNQNLFYHFDGAIRSYDYEMMLDRVSQKFTEFGRKAGYTKLFRLDGQISLGTWKTLTTHYLQGNRLIYEYFGLGDKLDALRPAAIDHPTINKYLPFQTASNNGLRILLSYHIPDPTKPQGRTIDITDVISDGEKDNNCIEFSILELQKSLERIGETLEIPDDIILIKCNDQYWNIPSILHSGPNSVELFKKTIEALNLLFSSMLKKKFNKYISLTLSLACDNEKLIRISVFGHISVLVDWLNRGILRDFKIADMSTWAETQLTYLNKYNYQEDALINSLVQKDGVLYIKRTLVMIPYTFTLSDDLDLTVKFDDPANNSEEVDLFESDLINPALLLAVNKCVWSDTKEDYITSNRSKWLDEETALIEIVEAKPLGLFWASP